MSKALLFALFIAAVVFGACAGLVPFLEDAIQLNLGFVFPVGAIVWGICVGAAQWWVARRAGSQPTQNVISVLCLSAVISQLTAYLVSNHGSFPPLYFAVNLMGAALGCWYILYVYRGARFTYCVFSKQYMRRTYFQKMSFVDAQAFDATMARLKLSMAGQDGAEIMQEFENAKSEQKGRYHIEFESRECSHCGRSDSYLRSYDMPNAFFNSVVPSESQLKLEHPLIPRTR